MLVTSNLSLSFGKRVLFKEVNLKFTPGNCYGVIGANGAGKSTFLKVLSGDIEASSGVVSMDTGKRMTMLRQDHFAFDTTSVLNTVIMGHAKLWKLMGERDALYAKPDFSDKDGERASEIEAEVAEMNGYEAESDAGSLLSGLGVPESVHQELMGNLEQSIKIRVLLAQALFGNPDILLLDEPTNGLDLESINWLEEFLYNFENVMIVVSHDRHFLNRVCTHICDIDYGFVRMYVGNYDFWYQAAELALAQKRNENKRKEDKAKDLEDFIRRFSSNASKARQATSRKKLLEKLTIDEMPITTRKFPYIAFKPERECGKIVCNIEHLCLSGDNETFLKDFSFTVNNNDKIAFIGNFANAKTALFEVLGSTATPDSGTITWGVTINKSYFPKDNTAEFATDLSILDWLRQFTKEQDNTTLRSFLGRLLFTGDEGLKPVNVISGGERVRCLLARMMTSGANVIILDEPTNHLDLESIQALNEGLINFTGVALFSSHDHEFVNTIANRIIEITPAGVIDVRTTFDEYMADPEIQKRRDKLYKGHTRMSL